MKKIIVSILVAFVLIMSTIPVYASDAPSEYSNEEYVMDIGFQDDTQWCAIYAVVHAVETKMNMLGMEVPDGGFSEAWLYVKVKEIDCNPQMEGTYLPMVLKVAKEQGLMPDYLYPTEEYMHNIEALVPNDTLDVMAQKYRITSYNGIDLTVDAIKNSIANDRIVLISSAVEPDTWYDSDPLILPSNDKNDGFHVTYLVGYDDNNKFDGYKGFFNGVNSWGITWGDNGKYYMSYDYIDSNYFMSVWEFEIIPDYDFVPKRDIFYNVYALKEDSLC